LTAPANANQPHAHPVRASGILLHVTSLPSPFGIGDLGPEAYRWIDFLASARQRWWQVLPVGPVAAGGENSPYRPASAFAGNPLLVSPVLLVANGWLDAADLVALEVPAAFLPGHVDYDVEGRTRMTLLERASRLFFERGPHADFDAFCHRHASWLEPFARFRAEAAPAGEREHAVRHELCIQFFFEQQWDRLRAYAHERGVHIFGDIPFYVDEYSADVQHQPRLFKLDAHGRPRVVAGVPPDGFSATGQLWGNPVYDWAEHARDGFAWWVARIRRSLDWFDMVRLDHFRAFAAHWEVPAGHDTALRGAWVPGPGRALLDAVVAACPSGSLVAEDLGTITDDVRELMRAYGLPGMKVILFAFDGDSGSNPYAPHHHRANAIVYTGTHDNNTARGWFEQDAGVDARARLSRYTGSECTAANVSETLVRMAMMSVCDTAILPLQDVLGLDGAARMNHPASPTGNWAWRFESSALTPALAQRLADLSETYGRV
jgi:4-alpha-glucanotransferase